MIWYQNRFEVLQHAAAIAPDNGLVLEFGVATGSTIRCLAESPPLRNRSIYGFDSFKGLPEPWASYSVGHFACDIPEVPSNVGFVVGLFQHTIRPFLAVHPGDIALVHIDCDLYSSVRSVLEQLDSRIIRGTVIVLDEYWIITEHEQRAFLEWLVKTGRAFRKEARAVEQLCGVIE